jgi:S1/P1 Nuclease
MNRLSLIAATCRLPARPKLFQLCSNCLRNLAKAIPSLKRGGMKKLVTTFALILVGVPFSEAQAWSRETHMTTGAIAFDDLDRTSPALLAQLEPILAAHPHRIGLDTHLVGLTGKARNRAMFEWLARWSDDVRGTPYDNPDWHYELRVISPWAKVWRFRNGTARAGFDENYRIFADPKAAVAARAIALGWLLHIVGDIQQPLHAAHWASGTYPLSDRAGTLGFVLRKKGGPAIDLHEYWDQILDRPGRANATSQAWAGPLIKEWPRARLPELAYGGTPQVQFSHWLDESLALARKAAYRGAFLRATPDPANAPSVSPAFAKRAEALARRRVVTGGYRIADVIRMALVMKQP